MKKGFTLVELLAVIIILGFVAALITPIATNVVNNAKRDSFKNAAYGIKRAAEMKFADIETDEHFKKVIFYYNDGVETSSIDGESLDYDGEKPESGNVIINEIGKVAFTIHKGKYCAYKSYDDNLIEISKKTKVECEKKWETLYTADTCFEFDEDLQMIRRYDFAECPNAVAIPDEINGIDVEHIGPGAFFDAETQMCWQESTLVDVGLNHIYVEGGPYEYCYFTFDSETYGENGLLTSVILPNNLKTISYDAFKSNSITEIKIPNGVTFIGKDAFASNYLTSVVIPGSVKTIDNNAFDDNKLRSVTIQKGVKTIGNEVFNNNLLTKIEIPSSVTSIDYFAFAYNQITQGNAIIYNEEGNVTVDESAFSYNGPDSDEIIEPEYMGIR